MWCKCFHYSFTPLFAEDDKNNQFLQNDGASQKLSRDEIMNLKAQGVSGKVKRFYASVMYQSNPRTPKKWQHSGEFDGVLGFDWYITFIPTILDKIPWDSRAKLVNY